MTPIDPDQPPAGSGDEGEAPEEKTSISRSRGAKDDQKLAEKLVAMAERSYRLIRGTDGRTYGVQRGDANLALPLAGRNGLKAALARSLYRTTSAVASGSALGDAMTVLDGEAQEKDPEEVFLRMGRDADGAVVVDMGTQGGHCIRITPEGWDIQGRSPVTFRRSELVHPLPEPVRGSGLDGLDGLRQLLVNLSDDDFRLVVAWMVAAYLVDILHPILLVQGEQGTAKSNLIRALLALVDPQPAADRTQPGDVREWAIFARASWAFSWDNVTEIPEWLSNSLCKGVTGDAVLQRALHSDEDVMVFSFRRTIAMTTIGIKGELAGDLADRMLLIEPEVLEPGQRLTESDVGAARAAVLPAALGAILDLVAGVLRELPGVVVDDLPRMADFARVLAALDAVTGWDTLTVYRRKITALGMLVIEGNTFARALYLLAEAQAPQPWEGTSGALLAALREICRTKHMPPGELPADTRQVGLHVSRIAPSLRKAGIDVRRRRSDGKRLLNVTMQPRG